MIKFLNIDDILTSTWLAINSHSVEYTLLCNERLVMTSYSLLLKSAVAYVIGISINDTDTFSEVRVRPPALVGLLIPIRVYGF